MKPKQNNEAYLSLEDMRQHENQQPNTPELDHESLILALALTGWTIDPKPKANAPDHHVLMSHYNNKILSHVVVPTDSESFPDYQEFLGRLCMDLATSPLDLMKEALSSLKKIPNPSQEEREKIEDLEKVIAMVEAVNKQKNRS